MAKKTVCPECDKRQVVEKTSGESYWAGGKEHTEVITTHTCNNCGYEWETKSGS